MKTASAGVEHQGCVWNELQKHGAVSKILAGCPLVSCREERSRSHE